GRSRNGFVAANNADDGVEQLTAADKLDGVGDYFAADERGPHPLGAHGLTVADRDGIELHRRAAAGANPLLHLLRKTAQVKVARHGFDPSVGHTDERPLEVFTAKPNGLEHGAGASAVAPVSDQMTTVFWIHRNKSLRQSRGKRKASRVLGRHWQRRRNPV